MKQRVQPQSNPPGRPLPADGVDAVTLAVKRLNTQRPLRKPLQLLALDLRNNRLEIAEAGLQKYLARNPSDADAMALLAEVAARSGDIEKAASLFAESLDIAPDFVAARFNFAKLLLKLNRLDIALVEADRLLDTDVNNPLFLQLKASVLEFKGDTEQMLPICERLVAEHPTHADSWNFYGHALRAIGQKEKSIAAYRKAIACRPSFGLAYWSLANMKSGCFSEADIAAMNEQLKRPDLAQDDRVMIQFSLGKAYEDAGLYERSFELYSKASAICRQRISYDPDALTSRVAATKALFTPEFLHSRANLGCAAHDPIFVLGRPRSGSTLIEQILSSHSAIEGTAELPYITDMAKRLEDEAGQGPSGYPRLLEALGPGELKSLGEIYMKQAEIYRKLDRPLFIDKKPANFSHIGLIFLILPNAKIIDARRNPAASGFSIFKQYRSKGGLRLNEIGRFYRDYVAYMAHFDKVAPGRIHRVIHEQLVADPEAEVRRMLDYLGLPFEESCLRFYETKRTVMTPSSEQVRKPISSEGVDHWRHYEPWLQPLIRSLGTALTEYPSVPDELR